MGWRVRSNHFGAIGVALPRNIDDGVQEVAEAMARELKATLWVDTGMIRRVTTEHAEGKMHAVVWVGYYLGHGFYSGFQEFGTRKQVARPIVGPTAHRYEPQYAKEMGQQVREACAAR